MNKRVFLVHGWGGTPESNWLPWLRGQLKQKGFEVHVPQLPNTEVPRIDSWVKTLADSVGQADGQTYFIGHSMGCQTIVRYLETLPDEIQVGGAVFVAGFLKRLTNCDNDPGEKETADHWMCSPIDLLKIATHLPKSVALFSDNDSFVPLDNQEEYRDVLRSKIVLEHAQGHLDGKEEGGIIKLPLVLSEFLQLSEEL